MELIRLLRLKTLCKCRVSKEWKAGQSFAKIPQKNNSYLTSKMGKIINLNGNAVQLSEIKSISKNDYFRVKPETNQIKIEFKARKELLFNLNSTTWEVHTFNDVLLIDCPDGEVARDNYFEILEQWEEALEETPQMKS